MNESPAPQPVTNAAAYRFAQLTDLKPLREHLLANCRQWDLKGTILLSTEGVNLFVAGSEHAVHQLLDLLRTVPGLADLQAKFSTSSQQPFQRMLVKIKREIITLGVPAVDPAANPAPRITPHELKQWLDQGRPVILLDTRNGYEVQLGTFRHAVQLNIAKFREFPAAVEQGFSPPPDQPIVTFCTGGIRCEKAAPWLIQHGFQHVLQLDGGILKYFEECGQTHFDGECFVFDERVGLSSDLETSGHAICYACQSLLTPAEAADPLYVPRVSCPRCYRPPDDEVQRRQAETQARLQSVVSPLPGSIPRDNLRPLRVPARHDGLNALDLLCALLPQFPRSQWQQQFDQQDILNAQRQPVRPDHRVHAGERYYTRERQLIEPDVNVDIRMLHEDAALLVVDKPAPLPMHASGRYHRNTLEWILSQVYAPQNPRPAHRLDANTSGLTVWTRTAAFARIVQGQFERGEVTKTYLARVLGNPNEDHFISRQAIAPTTGRRGARVVDHDAGAAAQTDFQVLHRLADGTALLQVHPRTGRTNQIRVHLWHLGWPIVGDPMYLPGQQLGDSQTLSLLDPPLQLHAWKLAFTHPQHGRPVEFTSPAPDWAQSVATRLAPGISSP
ncbi:MAG: pseudouridine synthase [Pirellulales bacterium]